MSVDKIAMGEDGTHTIEIKPAEAWRLCIHCTFRVPGGADAYFLEGNPLPFRGRRWSLPDRLRGSTGAGRIPGG
jgi:hypothetical protein